jgi:predicted ArsR family transcriptional regulator
MLNWIESDTRRALLQLMKVRGSLSVDEGRAALDLARSTVREHLHDLHDRDLVRRFAEPSEGRGRPRHRYRLTEAAQALFPARDGELMHELLGFLFDQGATDLVHAFFERFWTQRAERVQQRLRHLAPDDANARLALLEAVLEDEGFMPEVHATSDTVVIRECNCPFPESVKRTRLPCRLEAAFYEALFEQEATRVRYIPDGHAACTYTFSRTGIAAREGSPDSPPAPAD